MTNGEKILDLCIGRSADLLFHLFVATLRPLPAGIIAPLPAGLIDTLQTNSKLYRTHATET